jgi:hypothetical protein
MNEGSARLGRRSACALLTATAITARLTPHAHAETALAAPMPAAQPTIAVAGPPDSSVARWAGLLRPHLAAGLGAEGGLRLRFVGGQDGVTGANQFDARAMPDGREALLLPGTAALAWLAGDSRVRFEAARLLPLLVSTGIGVLMIRGGAAGLRGARPLRVACATPVGPALTALIAFDLLGTPTVPVMPKGDMSDDLSPAARSGDVDAVFVHGLDAPSQLPALIEAGLRPTFSVAPAGYAGPPPATVAGLFAAPPDLDALLAASPRATPPVLAAWRAVAAASLMDIALALPRLCPSGTVAHWRRACAATQAASAVLPPGVSGAVRLLAGTDSEAAVNRIFVDQSAQLALRRWLGGRLNWQPT